VAILSAMIITMDGPAGAGKSTVARRLAEALHIAYLDTGATYRAATLRALRDGVDLTDSAALAAAVRKADIRLTPAADGLKVTLDGEDVTAEVRSDRVTTQVHHVAADPACREVLVELQRAIGRQLGSFVAEGRDQGSVVFPEADVKFYLTARPEVTAERRYKELKAAGEAVTYEQVLADIRRRDEHDRGREVAPLVVPAGAIEIDTSQMTVDEVVAELVRRVEAAR